MSRCHQEAWARTEHRWVTVSGTSREDGTGGRVRIVPVMASPAKSARSRPASKSEESGSNGVRLYYRGVRRMPAGNLGAGRLGPLDSME